MKNLTEIPFDELLSMTWGRLFPHVLGEVGRLPEPAQAKVRWLLGKRLGDTNEADLKAMEAATLVLRDGDDVARLDAALEDALRGLWQ